MKRSIFFVLALWALTISFSAVAAPARAPIKTVERLAYARDTAAGDKLTRVHCRATRNAYIFLCEFIAAKRCAMTYVHYNPRNPSYGRPFKVNFWAQVWACTSSPPIPPPDYPGDGGPGA